MKPIFTAAVLMALSGCASLPPYQLTESELSQAATIQNSDSRHDGRYFRAFLVAVDHHPVMMRWGWILIFPARIPASESMKVAAGRRTLAIHAGMLKLGTPPDDCSLSIDADIEGGKTYEVSAELAGPGEDFCVASLKEKMTQVVPPFIHMERGACRGFCPIYQLDIFPDGTVSFTGAEFTLQKGERHASISEEAINKLRTAVEQSGALELKDDCCSCLSLTDAETVKLMIRTGSSSKSIEHYHGCRLAPKELAQLEDQIDELSGALQWIGTNEERRNKTWPK